MNEMITGFLNENYDIVIATRTERDESYYRKTTSSFFYKIIKKLSFPIMPVGGFDYVLLSERVKQHLLNNPESNNFWQGQILWTGFKTKFVSYQRQKRLHGKSRWSFGKKIKYLIDGIMGYSYFPLRLMSIVGLIVSLIGFIYAIIIVIERILGNAPYKGWAPIMILILILSGIQMLMLGVIGEYLWRTLDQARNRPKFIIDQIIE
jgi:dolichol-phosphate mannosyltransferase